MKNTSKKLFDKRYRYAIRRFTVGTASVAIGCLLFGANLDVVHANEASASDQSVEIVGNDGERDLPEESELSEEMQEIVASITELQELAKQTQDDSIKSEIEGFLSQIETATRNQDISTLQELFSSLPDFLEAVSSKLSGADTATSSQMPPVVVRPTPPAETIGDHHSSPAPSATTEDQSQIMNVAALQRLAIEVTDPEVKAEIDGFLTALAVAAEKKDASLVQELLSNLPDFLEAVRTKLNGTQVSPTPTPPVVRPIRPDAAGSGNTTSTPTPPIESDATVEGGGEEDSSIVAVKTLNAIIKEARRVPSTDPFYVELQKIMVAAQASIASHNALAMTKAEQDLKRLLEQQKQAFKERKASSELPIVDTNQYVLNYRTPAPNTYDGWEKQALPIGNGEIGSKVFGLVGEERIQFNEKTLWSGGPKPDSTTYNGGNREGKHRYLADIRKALEEGNLDRAKTLAQRHLVGPNSPEYGRYLSFGDIYVDLVGTSKELQDVSNYSRSLDLKTAISSTDYTYNQADYHRETFVSYPDNVSVTRFTKTGDKNLELDIRLEMTRELKGESAQSDYKQSNITYSEDGILMSGTVVDNRMKFASFVKVDTDGETTVVDGKLRVTGATYANVYLSAETDFAQNPKTNYRMLHFDVEKFVRETANKAATKGYEQIKAAHIADYQSIFNRVKLNLNTKDTNGPTNQLLSSYTSENGQELEELFFQFGRYLMITSSRDGKNALPANLQGVWNAVDNPPWNSDYHLNVNLQMNYWPVYSTNMAETAIPLINYIDDMRYYGRVAAKEYAGIASNAAEENGWLAHTQATPFGWTTPGWSYYWGWSPASNAWIMQNVYDYYRFTKDEDYLREKIYPMLKETAKFWNSFLHYDKTSDRFVSSPSYSPEHGTITIGNTYDQSLVWQLFHDFMEAATVLGQDADLVATIRQKFDKLSPLHINSEGRIKEWYEEDTDRFTEAHHGQPGHRHVSELVGLFPGTLFSKDKPAYLEAAKATLNNRGDGGTGWSKANKINLWARLLDGDRAHRLLAEQLKASTLTNLWDTHPPFQIDGNFGATSGMAEMLLQSHSGYIALLPALPSAWANGQVSGLMARGNVEVDMSWKDMNLEKVRLIANNGGKLILDYPNIETARVLVNGEEKAYKTLQNGRIELDTIAGDIVLLEQITGRINDLRVNRTGPQAAAIGFSAVKDATAYQIERVKLGTTETDAIKYFRTENTHFIDQTVLPNYDYSYRVRPIFGDEGKAYSEAKTIAKMKDLLDDRDPSIEYGSAFGDWEDSELWSGTEKFADITRNPRIAEDSATATIPFIGTGIEVYGLKHRALGTAIVMIDGEQVANLDFHNPATTNAEKGVLIGRYSDLTDGPHVMTIRVNPAAPTRPNETNKISLDFFKVLRDTSREYEVLDDRDPRIVYGSVFGNWTDTALYKATEKYGLRKATSTDEEASLSLAFNGTGIQIYGLKTNQLGKAHVLIDGERKEDLIFYKSGSGAEKGVLVGEYKGLTAGDHTIKLIISSESLGGQKKISLDRFVILKQDLTEEKMAEEVPADLPKLPKPDQPYPNPSIPDTEDGTTPANPSPQTPDQPSPNPSIPDKEDGVTTPDVPSSNVPETQTPQPNPKDTIESNPDTGKVDNPILPKEDKPVDEVNEHHLKQPLELLDEATGVRVILEEGETDKIVAIRVQHKETGHNASPIVLADKDYDLYDIVLVDAMGQVVHPTRPTLVILPIDDGKEVFKVVYLPNASQSEELEFTEVRLFNHEDSTRKGVAFVARHFSEYGLLYKPVANNTHEQRVSDESVLLMNTGDGNKQLKTLHQDSAEKDKQISQKEKQNELPNTGTMGSTALSLLGIVGLLGASTIKKANRRRR